MNEQELKAILLARQAKLNEIEEKLVELIGQIETEKEAFEKILNPDEPTLAVPEAPESAPEIEPAKESQISEVEAVLAPNEVAPSVTGEESEDESDPVINEKKFSDLGEEDKAFIKERRKNIRDDRSVTADIIRELINAKYLS